MDEQVGEEAGAGAQPLADRLVGRLGRRLAAARRRPEQVDVLAEVQRHLAGAAPERAGADPHDLAGRAQLVQPAGRVGAGAAREHVLLPHVDRQRHALERHQHVAQPVDPGAGRRVAVHALPARHEARERALVGRLDLLAQRGQRGAPQPPQHLGVAPLALGAAGAQLAAHQVAGALQPGQHRRQVQPVAVAQLRGLERAVHARPAAHEALHRVGDVADEGVRQARGRHGAERVAQQPRVLGGGPAQLAVEAQPHRAALAGQLSQPLVGGVRRRAARLDLLQRQVADPAQHVVQRVHRVRARALARPLQVGLDLLQRGGVDQLAQLLLAEQLAQQLAVQRQRGGAALRVGRVALVHVRRDVVEQQRGGERRGGRRLDLDERQLARVELAQQVGEARHVEHVAQALAVGLQHDRELRVALGDLQQRLRLQPLLPQRRALAGIGARDQQRPAGVLAEPRAEQRRAAQLADHAVLDLVRVDQDEVGAGRLVGVGQVDDDPVVGPDGVRLEVVLVADLGAQRQAPGGVHAAAERREDAQPPVADLVAEALDDDRAVARHDAGRVLLLAQERDQVLGGQVVEVVALLQRGGVLLDRPAGERADRLAQLARAPDAVAAPERHRAGDAGSRGDDHAVARDLLDPPARRAEQERLPRAGLVDHLLVELADPAAVGEVDAEEPAVRDRAGVGDGQRARALAGAQRPGHAVPHDPRPQLAELLASGSGRRACRARSPAAAATARRTSACAAGARGGRRRPAARPRRRRWPPSRRSAGPARRAGCAGRRWSRSCPRACAGRPRRTRAGRRGTWGRCGPWRCRRRCGRRGRSAAGRA